MSRWRVVALAREVFLRRGCSSEATGSQAQASCGRNSGSPLTFPPKPVSSAGRQSCFSPSPAQGYFPQVVSNFPLTVSGLYLYVRLLCQSLPVQIPQVTPHRLAWAAVVTGISVTAAVGLTNVELQNLIQGGCTYRPH